MPQAGEGMPILMETTVLNETDRTVFPVVTLNAGMADLKIDRQEGINTLLVKCQGGTVANWFTCYISDPGDLDFAPTPEKLKLSK